MKRKSNFPWLNIKKTDDGLIHNEKDTGRSKLSQTGFYAKARWMKLRDAYRKRFPLCSHCLRKGKITPMAVVDHILSADYYDDLIYEWSNLQSLCDPCHQSKTARDTHVRYGHKTKHVDQSIMDELENTDAELINKDKQKR